MTCCLILPAAGFGRRMQGADKLLEDVEGKPCLRVLAERGLAAGLNVRVCVPDLSHPRAQALENLGVTVIAVEDRAEGMAASLRVAFNDLQCDSAMVLPADMPEITTEDLRAVAQAEGLIVRATSSKGKAGHPVRFDRQFFEALSKVEGDTGARAIVQHNKAVVVHVTLPGAHAVTDLDTVEAWREWRARN